MPNALYKRIRSACRNPTRPSSGQGLSHFVREPAACPLQPRDGIAASREEREHDARGISRRFTPDTFSASGLSVASREDFECRLAALDRIRNKRPITLCGQCPIAFTNSFFKTDPIDYCDSSARVTN